MDIATLVALFKFTCSVAETLPNFMIYKLLSARTADFALSDLEAKPDLCQNREAFTLKPWVRQSLHN